MKVVVIRRQGEGSGDEIKLVKAMGGKVYQDLLGHFYTVFTDGTFEELQVIPHSWVEV